MAPTGSCDDSEPWTNRTWLQEVLRDLEGDPSLSIIDHHVKDSNSKGDHFLSEMHRITVRLRRTGNTESEMFLIAKKLPSGTSMQKTLSESSAFPNEIKVFTHILPEYQSILENIAPGKFQPFAARHICSQDKVPYFLIVSDLAPEGFRMANRKHGLDLDHCLHVMKTLARYHATSVLLHERDPELIESMKENMVTEISSNEFFENFSKPSINSVAKIVQSWPDGGEKMAKRLTKLTENICQVYKELFDVDGNRLNVLIHGDLWVNNLLFKYNDVTGKIENMRLVDFQMACYNSCAIDLQYFMYTSPTDEVRISHTEDLLREYHSELCSTLKLLGLSEKTITFQELLEEYESKGRLGFFTAQLVLPLALADTENAPDMEGYAKGNNQSGGNDARATNKEYVNVIKRLLPFFEQKGYF